MNLMIMPPGPCATHYRGLSQSPLFSHRAVVSSARVGNFGANPQRQGVFRFGWTSNCLLRVSAGRAKQPEELVVFSAPGPRLVEESTPAKRRQAPGSLAYVIVNRDFRDRNRGFARSARRFPPNAAGMLAFTKPSAHRASGFSGLFRSAGIPRNRAYLNAVRTS